MGAYSDDSKIYLYRMSANSSIIPLKIREILDDRESCSQAPASCRYRELHVIIFPGETEKQHGLAPLVVSPLDQFSYKSSLNPFATPFLPRPNSFHEIARDFSQVPSSAANNYQNNSINGRYGIVVFILINQCVTQTGPHPRHVGL